MPPERVGVLAATSLEHRAVARRVRGYEIVECGVGLSRVHELPPFDVAISCGLAGGLRAGLATGSVLIPQAARATSGERIVCDSAWTQRLREAARALGYEPLDAPLLTSTELVTGERRAHWARDGYAGVDMETAFVPLPRIAAVRVVLDTPERELSPEWIAPARALMRPHNWPQALWLARNAGRCADIAALIVARALAQGA